MIRLEFEDKAGIKRTGSSLDIACLILYCITGFIGVGFGFLGYDGVYGLDIQRFKPLIFTVTWPFVGTFLYAVLTFQVRKHFHNQKQFTLTKDFLVAEFICLALQIFNLYQFFTK